MAGRLTHIHVSCETFDGLPSSFAVYGEAAVGLRHPLQARRLFWSHFQLLEVSVQDQLDHSVMVPVIGTSATAELCRRILGYQ